MQLEQEKENAQKSNNQGEVDSMLGIEVSYQWVGQKEAKGPTHSLVLEHQ